LQAASLDTQLEDYASDACEEEGVRKDGEDLERAGLYVR